MADIRHRVGINAPAERVFEALTTTDGLARWWTTTVDGASEAGDRLRFYFGQAKPGATMQVEKLAPRELVQWRCVEGPEE